MSRALVLLATALGVASFTKDALADLAAVGLAAVDLVRFALGSGPLCAFCMSDGASWLSASGKPCCYDCLAVCPICREEPMATGDSACEACRQRAPAEPTPAPRPARDASHDADRGCAFCHPERYDDGEAFPPCAAHRGSP